MEQRDGVCIEMTEIASIPKGKDSPLNGSFLESSSVTSNILQYLTLSDVKNLMFTSKPIYNSAVQSLDWTNRVSELFYPCGFKTIKNADSSESMDRQMNVYKDEKATAESLYYLLKMYRPLFNKYKRRTSILQIVYLFLMFLCILTFLCHVLRSSWVFREEGYVPVFLIVHLVTLYALYALTYLISSTISSRIDCDTFYYHLGYSLYLPEFFYYGFPLFPHLGLMIILYTLHYGLWYLSYIGYLLQSTCCWLDACLCVIGGGAGYYHYCYLYSHSISKDQEVSTKLARKYADSYYPFVFCIIVFLLFFFVLFACFYESGNWFFFVMAMAPYLLLVYLMIKDPEERLLYLICLGIGLPYAVYWVFLFISYNWVLNNKFWTSLILSFYTLAVLGFVVYFAYCSIKGFRYIINRKSFSQYVTLCVNRIPEAMFIRRAKSLFPLESTYDYDSSLLNEDSFLKVVDDVLNHGLREDIDDDGEEDDDDQFTVTSTETEDDNNQPNPVPLFIRPVPSPTNIQDNDREMLNYSELVMEMDVFRELLEETILEMEAPGNNEENNDDEVFSVD